MTSKRPRDIDYSPVEQQSKRRHVSFPQTPVASASSSTPSRTPYTPYPLRASDSPSNPFGRKRTQRLIHALPPETSFSRHLALRFQFVRRGVGPKQGGVYRVVQVPLSYTFTHLRCLIAFLFGVQSRGDKFLGPEDEHLFEIKKRVGMYSQRHKPGQIKTGKTWAKLSSVQDPCRWRSMYERDALEDDEDDEEVDENEEEAEDQPEEDEENGWKWEDEEVFTVAHAWPEGVDTERGIIYHHSRTTQVHITINTTIIPRRRGVSNTPFVFCARGKVRLSPAPLPRPVFAPPTKLNKTLVKPLSRRASPSKVSRKQGGGCADSDAEEDIDAEFESYRPFDENHPFVTSNYDDETVSEEEDEEDSSDDEEDSSDDEEDISIELSPEKWNKPEDAFALHLARFMGPPQDSDGHSAFSEGEDDEKEESQNSMMSTPGLTLSPSPGIPSSSPFRSSSPQSSSFDLFSPSSFPLSDHYPNKKYKYTPAPPKAKVHRMRIERVQKRMEKAKKNKWLCARDESPETSATAIDELVDEEEEYKFVKPVLKPGEVWDPFGDEIEL